MLKIGDLSRLARVTVKALRHYDAIGLLRAEHVEPKTGYRYYSLAQVERLQRIIALKQLGFGLDAIRTVLDAKSEDAAIRAAFERRRAELAAEIDEQTGQLQKLDAWLGNAAVAPSELPLIRGVEPLLAYALRRRVRRDGNEIAGMFEDAEVRVATHNARAAANPFLIFHDPDFPARSIDVEVCVPVKDRTRLEGVVEIAGHRRVASATYRGPYARTEILYGHMLDWLARAGHAVEGPLREVYHRFGADQLGYRLPARMLAASAENFVTELQVPLA